MSNSTNPIPELDRKGLREFGLITGAIVGGLFGLIFPWLMSRSYPIWPWIVLAVLGIWGIAAPMTLRPLYRAWMKFGLLLSRITTPIIMGLVFYLLITPFALIFKAAGRDPMRRKFENSETYRVTRGNIRDDNLEHPY